jgi:riboflavin kinase / FMN adenylyltransferase
LFDFDQDIYGQDVEVAFLQYLRPKQKFSGIEELQAQIRRDAQDARRIYEGDSPSSQACGGGY